MMDPLYEIVKWSFRWTVFFSLISDCSCKYCYTSSTGAYLCQYTYGAGESGEIAGIVIGAVIGLAVLIGILVCCVTKCNKKKKQPRAARPTRVQVSEANRRDHMPPESMPMYGMFTMPPPPPSMPEYAPPSYDSHNFNHPPPTVSATVSVSAGHNHGIGFHDVEDDDFLPPAY